MRFEACAIALTFLVGLSTPLRGEAPPPETATFKFVVEGPFLVCEEAKGTNRLTIWIPKLTRTHYIPGFSTLWNEVPLGDPSHPSKYVSWKKRGATDFSLSFNSANKVTPGGLALKTRDKVNLYHEHSDAVDCSGVADSKYTSVSVSVPFPDTIWTIDRGMENSYVKDKAGKYLGPCAATTDMGCRHATGVVFEYDNTIVGSVKLTDGGGGGSVIALSYQPEHASEFELRLDVLPITRRGETEPAAFRQSEKAFKQLNKLLKTPRTLKLKKASGVENAILHTDCKSVIMFVCDDGNACQ